jgi:hypothetical protein
VPTICCGLKVPHSYCETGVPNVYESSDAAETSAHPESTPRFCTPSSRCTRQHHHYVALCKHRSCQNTYTSSSIDQLEEATVSRRVSAPLLSSPRHNTQRYNTVTPTMPISLLIQPSHIHARLFRAPQAQLTIACYFPWMSTSPFPFLAAVAVIGRPWAGLRAVLCGEEGCAMLELAAVS